MKKIIVIVFLMLFVTGCGYGTVKEDAVDTVNINYSIIRIIDKEAGVVCYYTGGGYQGGVDCLSLKDTNLSGE
jgi:hypothetical protein